MNKVCSEPEHCKLGGYCETLAAIFFGRMKIFVCLHTYTQNYLVIYIVCYTCLLVANFGRYMQTFVCPHTYTQNIASMIILCELYTSSRSMVFTC